MTGVILAGGSNRRMGGRLKALLPVDGEPLLVRQLAEMGSICKQVLIITNAPEALAEPLSTVSNVDVQCFSDRYVQTGPLGGLHAACLAANEPLLWVVGCDMPYISAAAAKAMERQCVEAGCDAVVPVIDGRVHPLHGIYSRNIGESAETLLVQERYRLMGLLEQIAWTAADQDFFRERGIPTHFVMNVNTPEDYQKISH
ncbi:molybdenum cofactor guanylyltransferase [Paenibacillus sp. SI8]|uniref:molybdenum cofactor guanylyltransferase n=1 Tax=unclassified Paenibacillus TaxID=185978 RepID=UPI0034670262